MKILVFAHKLVVGGTPINAIDLAVALRDLHGHQVVFFAAKGPLLDQVVQRGLRYIQAPEAEKFPSSARMAALRRLVKQEKPDLVHAWDWFQAIDAYFSVHLSMGVPLLVTDMMMDLTRFMPRNLPATFGTLALVHQARAAGHKHVSYLPPPVDTQANRPQAVSSAAFRRDFGIDDKRFNVVIVSRLARSMKLDSIERAIRAISQMAMNTPVRLVIVGGGDAHTRIAELAAQANALVGQRAVVLTGELLDPRPAYQCADAVIGMGGSSLRAMAFAKPVIVVGEKGFSKLLEPSSVDCFLHQGFFGYGDGSASVSPLLSDLYRLSASSSLREKLGHFGRQITLDHFSIAAVSGKLSALCHDVATQPSCSMANVPDALRTVFIYLRERRFQMRFDQPTEAIVQR
jgi:glycosyltransferase involved in cell wall biosynthesis